MARTGAGAVGHMQSVDAIPQSGHVMQALRHAAARTGVGFDYLLDTAVRESSLDTTARAETSSAAGLFQFVEQTWLETLKRAGQGLGLAHLADRIERTAGGRYEVSDPAAREEILSLRHDPTTAALMAAALTRRNAAQLAGAIGRQPTGGELYVAHFLGAGDAARLIELTAREPGADAAAAFPRAAKANPAIFAARDGTPRSAAQVYATLTRRHGAGTNTLAETVRSIETQVAGFFSSLFRVADGGARPAPAERTEAAPPPPARPARPAGAPLVLADFKRPRLGAVPFERAGTAEPAADRLTARAAYGTQVRWFAALYRG